MPWRVCGCRWGRARARSCLTSDEGRRDWTVDGPHFGDWEIYHLKGSPVDPDRIWASQTSGWFGQQVQRSEDGGRTWNPVGKDFSYAGVPGTHQWYDGTSHSWEFARVGHFEPSLTDRDTVFAGVEDAALFKTTDGGETWKETVYVLPILSDSQHYPPDGKLRVYRSRTGGNEWEPLTKGLPQENCFVNVLRDAMAVDRPGSAARGLRGRSADRGHPRRPLRAAPLPDAVVAELHLAERLLTTYTG